MMPNLPQSRTWTRSLCLLSSLLMLGNLPLVSDAAAAPPAVTPQGEPPAFGLLAEAQRRIPRETFDLQAVVRTAGHEPDALLTWVRSNTSAVPYRGLLRGPIGVLMDRRGSALDRAYLLHGLLGVAGVEARLVQGRLQGALIEHARSQYRQLPPAGGVGDAEYRTEMAEVLREFTEQNPEYRSDLEHHAAADVASAWRQAEHLAQRVTEQTQALKTAVGTHEIDSTVSPAVLSDHWWVEWRADTGGPWHVLDPVFSDLDTAAREAIRIRALQPRSLAEFGADSLHRVAFRFVIECWDDGELGEFTVLDHEILSAAHWQEPIELQCAPTRWPLMSELAKSEDTHSALREAALANDEWVPKLAIGNKTAYKFSFTADGQVSDATLPYFVQYVKSLRPLASAVGSGAEKAGGRVLEAMSWGRAPASAPAEPQRQRVGKVVTSAWIEYVIHSPDAEPRTIRRALFDGIGEAARRAVPVPEPSDPDGLALKRALALLGTTRIHIEVCRPSLAYAEHVWAGNTLARLRELRAAMGGTQGVTVHPFDSRRPLELAYARGAHSGASRELFVGSPGIVTWHSLTQPGADGLLEHVRGFDIVADGLALHPAADDGFALRLEQGVLDTCVEALAMQHLGDVENAAELFARVDDWVTLASSDDPDWQRLQLSEDLLLLLRDQVVGGAVVHAPIRPVGDDGRYAWWRIDPLTGETLGFGSRGWGQAVTEGFLHIKHISIPSAKANLDFIMCLNKSVIGGKGMNQSRLECLCNMWVDEVIGFFKGKLWGLLDSVQGAIDSSGLGPAAKLAASSVWGSAKGKAFEGLPDPVGDGGKSLCSKLGEGVGSE